ncbi:MAG: helix-turn-helix transcriptional regulator [Rikenellaceae bacterium]|nr:helix-turn-helix transcriptional regulator [Rikenellaceae bacterium]
MKERLRRFIKAEALNSTQLATALGIQSSGISHILSGRNKPSYDFVTKLLTLYPNLNPDWLLLGKGTMYRQETKEKKTVPTPSEPMLKFSQTEDHNAEPLIIAQNDREGLLNDFAGFSATSDSSTSSRLNVTSTENKSEITHNGQDVHREVERIVILYRDGSFDTYHPR